MSYDRSDFDLDFDFLQDTAAVARGGATPGKRTVTSMIPAAPQLQMIFRVADADVAAALGAALAGGRPERDGNGVTAGAEEAVARAAGSSGQALPGDLLARFQAALGADLSGVRIHTGAESAQAAGAVGARAYTVGQDIHFGPGQFDPTTTGGQHLIAHEVAHTVQQAGGTAHRQHKLAVSTPGDAAEVEADRAADAMVAGSPATVAPASGVALAREGFHDDADLIPAEQPAEPLRPFTPRVQHAVLQAALDRCERHWVGELRPAAGAAQAIKGHKLVGSPAPGGPTYGKLKEAAGDQVDLSSYAAAFAGAWGFAAQTLTTAGTMVAEFDTAAEHATEQGLGGGSRAGADGERSRGVLQKDSFPEKGSVIDAVEGGRPMGSDRPMSIGKALAHMDMAEAAAAKIRPDKQLIEAHDAVTAAEVDLNAKIGMAMVGRISYSSAAKLLSIACNNAVIAREKKVQAGAGAEKSGQETEKAAMIGAINAIASAASVVESAAVKGGTPGSGGAPAPGGVKEAGAAGGISKSIGAYVGFFVGLEYDQEITRLNQALLLSDQVIAGVEEENARTQVALAKSALQTSLIMANAARAQVIPAENARRRALDNLAQVALVNAARNNGKVEEVNALHALIAGLPAIELVVSKLAGLTRAIHQPPYSKEAGIGAGLCPDAGKFVDACSILMGAKLELVVKQTEWEAKAQSVRNMRDNMVL